MPQYRLEHYFAPKQAPPTPSGRSFLDLPHSVRKLVYTFAGLQGLVVDVNYSNLKLYPKHTYPTTDDCRKLDTVGWYKLHKLDVADVEEVWEISDSREDVKEYGRSIWDREWGVLQSMLLVSRQIHKEVEAFVYSTGVLRVCMGQPLGLKRFWRLGDHAVEVLGALTVRLDVEKAMVEKSGWKQVGDAGMPSMYLDFSKKWGKAILKSWIRVLERLTRIIQPGQLSLRVVFRAKTMSDARAVIESMLQLPLLKDCGICAELEGQGLWWRAKLVSTVHLVSRMIPFNLLTSYS